MNLGQFRHRVACCAGCIVDRKERHTRRRAAPFESAGDQHNPLAPAEVLWKRIVGSRGAQNGLNPVG